MDDGSPRRGTARTWLIQTRSRRRLEARAAVAIDPTARIGRLAVSGRGRRGQFRVGPRSVIEDGVVVHLHEGGSIDIGADVTIRRGAVLNVQGHLVLRGRNLISWYSVVHCAESVVFEELSGTGEGVTVVDSTHFHGEPGAADEHWYHNNRTAPVVIGRNTWLASRCTVTRGTRIGARTTVATQAVVRSGEYPDGATLVGAPARVLHPERHEARAP
jgi:acetyltransferase-like isoleucine patch superfamily enzyme